MTCVGSGKPSFNSSGGGLIMRTDGCQYGVVYSASFTVTRRLDPSAIILTASGQVTWLVQLWQGDYVTTTAPVPSV